MVFCEAANCSGEQTDFWLLWFLLKYKGIVHQVDRGTECSKNWEREQGGEMVHALQLIALKQLFLSSRCFVFLVFLCGNYHQTCHLSVSRVITLQILSAPVVLYINHLCFHMTFTVFKFNISCCTTSSTSRRISGKSAIDSGILCSSCLLPINQHPWQGGSRNIKSRPHCSHPRNSLGEILVLVLALAKCQSDESNLATYVIRRKWLYGAAGVLFQQEWVSFCFV